MKINSLKSLIEKNNLSNEFLIFVCKDSNTFLASQYVDKIAENKNLIIHRLKNLNEIASALSLVQDFSTQLNILIVEEFDGLFEDYSVFENTIVVCNKIAKNIELAVKEYIIEFPKLLDWQIKEYMKIYCKGLEEENIDWLYSVTNGDIYRIINELDKIKLFNLKERQLAFNDLKFDNSSDLYNLSAFELCDAIIKKDKLVILDYLKHKNASKIDSFYLISLLISKLKQIIYVNFNSGLSIEKLGLTQKQVGAIKYYYKNCSEKFSIDALEFLTEIDKNTKLGKLEIANLNEFIICHLLIF